MQLIDYNINLLAKINPVYLNQWVMLTQIELDVEGDANPDWVKPRRLIFTRAKLNLGD